MLPSPPSPSPSPLGPQRPTLPLSLPCHSLAPGYSSLFLFLSSFLSSLLSLLASPTLLHPCCHSLRKTRPFPPRRVSIFSLDGPCRAVDIRAPFSQYINTLISNLVIFELSYFHAGLNVANEEIIHNCINLDFSHSVSHSTFDSSSAYFHIGLTHLQKKLLPTALISLLRAIFPTLLCMLTSVIYNEKREAAESLFK